MCGILGIVNTNNSIKKAFQDKLLCKLFTESETRGKEASGFCFVKEDEIIVGKTSESASFLIKTKDFKNAYSQINNKPSEFSLYFGHARLVTHGYEQYAKNNQPVCTNNMVLVHNGIVINYKALWEEFLPDQIPDTELDTEIIPLLYHHFLSKYGDSQKAISNIFDVAIGVINIALYDIENSKFLLCSNNGSLYYYKTPDSIVFGSEKRIVRNSLLKSGYSNSDSTEVRVDQISKEQILIIDLQKNKSGLMPVINIIDIDKKLKKKHINTSLEHSDSILIPDEFYHQIEFTNAKVSKLKRCTKCLLPETFPGIQFDEKGVCNVCNSYPSREFAGKEALDKVITNLLKEKPVLIAFSGGRDSSYCLHYLKKESR